MMLRKGGMGGGGGGGGDSKSLPLVGGKTMLEIG